MINNEDMKYIMNLNFWEYLSDAEKQFLINNISTLKYSKGENLNSGDKECLGYIIVKSGELITYILSEEGRDVTLYRLTDGDTCVLAASCILRNITFDVLIDVEQDTEILLLNVAAFNKLSQENIHVENYAYKSAADRFSDVMWLIEQMLFMSFDKRLAVFLNDEMVKNKSNGIKLTHEQIAKYMGSAREVVSRMLKNFESQGIVKLSRGHINVMDKEKLRNMI